jgi:beta-lactamase superfamily II metal-dependent hydrolase
MATAFVTRKTARVEAIPPDTEDHVLIFGEEVSVQGPAVNGRVPVLVRGRKGLAPENALGPDAVLELYFVDVGQGDAAFIVTPGRKRILIDGGQNRQALGFLSWKYRLNEDVPDLELDLMVVSHGDSDHLEGLTPIIEHPKIRVKRIVHSGIAAYASGAFQTSLGDLEGHGDQRLLVTRHDGIADLQGGAALSRRFARWRDAIAAEGCEYGAVESTSGDLDVGDGTVRIEVLAPRLVTSAAGSPAYPYFDDPAHTINGHSVVLRITYGDVRVLFSGDLNIQGSDHLLADETIAGRLDSHVLKAPHHGSHEYEPRFLDAVRPQIGVISSGDDPDHGHPRASYIGAAGKAMRTASPLVFSTEIAADFVEANDPPPTVASAGEVVLDAPDATNQFRRLFKKRLSGMINVRTDGHQLYAARRVSASYQWESYGPLVPADRDAP